MNNENIKKLRNKYNWIEAFFLETMISIGIFITLFIYFLYKFRKQIHLLIVDDKTVYVFKMIGVFIVCCGIIYLLFYYIKIIKYKKLLMKLPLNYSDLKEMNLNTNYEIVEFYKNFIKVSPITHKPLFLNPYQEEKIKDSFKYYLIKILKEEFWEQDNFKKFCNSMNKYKIKIILTNKSCEDVFVPVFDNDDYFACLKQSYFIELNNEIKLFHISVDDSYYFYIKIDKL